VVLGADAGGSFDALNDVAVDSKGRIYVTHPRYGALAPGSLREPGVYRIDPDGTVTGIISDAARPNGIAICPDERHIIVGSYGHESDVDREMALLRYDLAPDGTAANRRMLIDYAPQHGPDGLTCDIEGNLWVAIRDSERPGIYAYAVTDGVATERAYIPTPELPTNVHFGRGEGANYLYLTAGSSLYGIRVGKRGHHLQPRSAMRPEGGRNRARAARETALQPLPRAMVPQNRSRRALRPRLRQRCCGPCQGVQ
jgi:gluconolactonase